MNGDEISRSRGRRSGELEYITFELLFVLSMLRVCDVDIAWDVQRLYEEDDRES